MKLDHANCNYNLFVHFSAVILIASAIIILLYEPIYDAAGFNGLKFPHIYTYIFFSFLSALKHLIDLFILLTRLIYPFVQFPNMYGFGNCPQTELVMENFVPKVISSCCSLAISQNESKKIRE